MEWTQNYDPFHNAFLSTTVAALPVVARHALPTVGMLGAAGFFPAPALGTPQRLLVVAAVLDKGSEFRLGDGRPRNAEGIHRYGVGPFLVVKDKWLRDSSAQGECTSGDFDVSRKCTASMP